MAVSYAMDLDERGKVEIRMSCPNANMLATFRMIFVLKGSLSLLQQGEYSASAQIGTQQHNLFRVPAHGMRMVMSNLNDDVICINLSDEFVNRYLPLSHPAHEQLKAEGKGRGQNLLSPSNMSVTPEISATLQRLRNTSQSGFCDQLQLESRVIELLALQIAQFEQMQDSVVIMPLKQEEQNRMQKAREILIHHTGSQLSLRSLAHLVGTNEFNLKRDFKAAFGSTVYQYLNQHKMEQAKSMLIEEDRTIAEIAIRTGYKHATHFTTAFKKYFGYLPNSIKTGKLSLLIFVDDFIALFENLGFLAT
jgi:AraC-like DNA-binding protein